MTTVNDEAIRAEIIRQINEKRSVAPREIASALTSDSDDWRKLLPRIKALAVQLETAEQLVFVRKKKTVSSTGLKGVYRFSKPGD